MSATKHEDMTNGTGAPLQRLDTMGSISITPEQFERMYLGPQNAVKGDLRKTFGNPTPVGLGGFVLALNPLVCQFMGWRGTGMADGLPTVGSYLFLGGLLAILASVGEFILGNSFPSLFFGVYGAFFLTYGVVLIPYYGAVTTFGTGTTVAEQYTSGAMSTEFNASVGLLATFLALFTFVMFIASFRTNVFFVLAFFSLFLTFVFYAVSRFYIADGATAANAALYMKYQVAAGGAGFATCIFGWYLLIVEILTTVDFPVNLPVFDLSGVVPGASDLAKRKQRGSDNYDSKTPDSNKV